MDTLVLLYCMFEICYLLPIWSFTALCICHSSQMVGCSRAAPHSLGTMLIDSLVAQCLLHLPVPVLLPLQLIWLPMLLPSSYFGCLPFMHYSFGCKILVYIFFWASCVEYALLRPAFFFYCVCLIGTVQVCLVETFSFYFWQHIVLCAVFKITLVMIWMHVYFVPLWYCLIDYLYTNTYN